MPRPPTGLSPCTNAPARRSAAWTTGANSKLSTTASRWSAIGARQSPARRRHANSSTRPARRAGDLFIDGALGSRTAWLHDPYDDAAEHRGTCYLDGDAVTAHLRACTDAGVTAGFHVIGDAAVASVVGALEQVVDDLGVPAVARCGHRLEHLEMVT